MDFATAIRTCLGKFTDFNGRASRAEFWWFYLFTALVNIVLALPYYALALGGAMVTDGGTASVLFIASIVWLVAWLSVSIALFIPFLAVGCRRLHDSGKSGWLLLLFLVPCGGLALLVLWILEGTPGENLYGPRLA